MSLTDTYRNAQETYGASPSRSQERQIAHVIRTRRLDTGSVTFYCGLEQPDPIEPDTVAPICAACVTAVFANEHRRNKEFLEGFARHIDDVIEAERSRVMGWVDSATLRIEHLERRLAKTDRKIRKLTKR